VNDNRHQLTGSSISNSIFYATQVTLQMQVGSPPIPQKL